MRALCCFLGLRLACVLMSLITSRHPADIACQTWSPCTKGPIPLGRTAHSEVVVFEEDGHGSSCSTVTGSLAGCDVQFC